MDIITIIGYKDTNFTAQDGNKITGTTFFFTMPDEHTIGLMSGKLFMTSAKIQKLSYIPRQGDVLKCYYDRYGKPVEFVPYEGDEY